MFRIVSYNLLSNESVIRKPHFARLRGWHNRQQRQAQILRSLDSDIIALQEFHYPQCSVVRDTLEDAGYAVVEQRREHFHINVLAFRETRFELMHANTRKSRALIVVLLDKSTNAELVVVNVHLDALDREARCNQLRSYHKVVWEYVYRDVNVDCVVCDRTVKAVNVESHNESTRHAANAGEPLELPELDLPVIWAGDFNATQCDSECTALDEFGLTRADASATPTHWSGRAVDAVFFNPNVFQITASFTGRGGFLTSDNPSDHLPVGADLTVSIR